MCLLLADLANTAASKSIALTRLIHLFCCTLKTFGFKMKVHNFSFYLMLCTSRYVNRKASTFCIRSQSHQILLSKNIKTVGFKINKLNIWLKILVCSNYIASNKSWYCKLASHMYRFDPKPKRLMYSKNKSISFATPILLKGTVT